MSVIRQAFTEVDNTTVDLSKVIAAIMCIGGVALSAFDVVVNHAHFSMQDYGVGFGSLSAGLAALFKFKKDSGDGQT